MRPLCIDLYCGLGGWAEGFLAEGYDVIGFDIERRPYPGHLVLQDVLTLDGAQFRNAAVIVGSSPCQEFSYRAMPWKRAKALPPPYLGIELFQAQFRIQREASEASGRYVPMVVENVCGAQKWVGRAAWHYGSYYLWGDVPALMPKALGVAKVPGQDWNRSARGEKAVAWNDTAVKMLGVKQHGSGPVWFDTGIAHHSSKSRERAVASALIAKIPFDLAQHIARCYKPAESEWSREPQNMVYRRTDPIADGGLVPHDF